MDLILILRIIIFIVFCLVGFQIGNWVSPSIKVENIEKFPSIKEECEKGICPEPKDWKEIK